MPALTDQGLFEQVKLRVAFTSRVGGVSEGAYASLNLSDRVGDDAAAVARNRALLCEAFGADPRKLVVPKQVHGVKIVSCGPECAGSAARVQEAASVQEAVSTQEPAQKPTREVAQKSTQEPTQEFTQEKSVHAARIHTNLADAQQEAEAGADAVLVSAANIPALLCFADCVPVILAAPSGSFAVVHAGWRGALAGIVGDAVRALLLSEVRAGSGCEADMLNAYIGPYIHAECFECASEVSSQFAEAYGRACAVDETHVNLGAVLRCDLDRAGVLPERIADADLCTVCNNESYFSYRAQDGCAGRHGAFAVWQGGCV